MYRTLVDRLTERAHTLGRIEDCKAELKELKVQLEDADRAIEVARLEAVEQLAIDFPAPELAVAGR